MFSFARRSLMSIYMSQQTNDSVVSVFIFRRFSWDFTFGHLNIKSLLITLITDNPSTLTKCPLFYSCVYVCYLWSFSSTKFLLCYARSLSLWLWEPVFVYIIWFSPNTCRDMRYFWKCTHVVETTKIGDEKRTVLRVEVIICFNH